jgi:aminodeoxyfutalosine deaminase
MILRAKYVMPSSHEVFENGAVRIVNDEIMDVGEFQRVAQGHGVPIHDLGDVALLPGFINAHTHLELGGLAGKIPRPASFTDWIRQVIAQRPTDRDAVQRAVAAGAEESLRAGTTTLVDITGTGHSLAPLMASPIRKRVHFETLGFDEERSRESLRTLRARLSDAGEDALTTVGVSPHAPYSTSETLYRECVRMQAEDGLPMCSHVAETVEEEEFVRDGTGPFADLLRSLGVDLNDWSPKGVTPVQYLHKLGFFRSSPLLVHGNYIRDEDIPILRDLNVTVVFCPRSHAYFGHSDHPFEKLFALGINIALGTDSLASTPSLSMLDEMRFVVETMPHVSPERVLTLAMLNGAKTMKVRAKIGGLRSGWKADIVAVRIPSGASRVPERILSDEASVVLTMVDGKVCYQATD